MKINFVTEEKMFNASSTFDTDHLKHKKVKKKTINLYRPL